ncbi:MAG: hypothetical protein ABUT20_42690 [Bacteroidota bacterium]
MKTKQEWLTVTSGLYFNCWMILIVIYQLSGWARISGAIITLWSLTLILDSIRINARHSLH